MPTKKRKEAERRAAEGAIAELRFWNKVMATIPAHIVPRLFAKSRISRNLLSDAPYLRRFAVKFDSKTGRPLKQVFEADIDPNVESRENREARARDIRERHRDVWGKRGSAAQIAKAEGLNVRTVQKYMKDFP
jgi:hypothetical protein